MSQTEKVELIPLAITDLSIKYARRLEGNKILHYRVSSIALLSGFAGDPFKTVSEYIFKNEGLEAVLVQNANQSKGALEAHDLSNKVLADFPSIRRALSQKRVTSQLYQYNKLMTFADRARQSTTHVDRQGNIHQVKRTSRFLIGLNLLADKLGLLSLIPSKYSTYIRQVVPVTYLTYSYEETDEVKAIHAMQEDLQRLHQRGLIMGHLSMPSTITMADTVGAGVARKVLFCFVVVDLNKLCAQLEKSPIDLPRKPLTELLGVKGEAFEGELGYNLTSGKYEIEIVDVNPRDQMTAERIQQAVQLNYLQNVDHVNDVARKMSSYINNSVIETSSENVMLQQDNPHLPRLGVRVNMKVTQKSDSDQ